MKNEIGEMLRSQLVGELPVVACIGKEIPLIP